MELKQAMDVALRELDLRATSLERLAETAHDCHMEGAVRNVMPLAMELREAIAAINRAGACPHCHYNGPALVAESDRLLNEIAELREAVK